MEEKMERILNAYADAQKKLGRLIDFDNPIDRKNYRVLMSHRFYHECLTERAFAEELMGLHEGKTPTFQGMPIVRSEDVEDFELVLKP